MKIRMCPSCHSTNIRLYMGAQLGVQYKCEDCGYIGPLIIEEEVEKKFEGKGFKE